MRIVVCGGRHFRSPAQVYRALDDMHAEEPIIELMQGGCPTGVDKFASEWAAKTKGVQGYVCRADWDKHGKAAGPIRNGRMLEWQPDKVVAFAGGTGTANMVKQAEAAGVPVQRVGPL